MHDSRKNLVEAEIYDFRDQLDKVLLFFIYNAIGDIFCSSVLTIGEKKEWLIKYYMKIALGICLNS